VTIVLPFTFDLQRMFRRFAFDMQSSRHPCALDHAPTGADVRRSSHLERHIVPRITLDALFQNRAF
jgi:hypothetical protein